VGCVEWLARRLIECPICVMQRHTTERKGHRSHALLHVIMIATLSHFARCIATTSRACPTARPERIETFWPTAGDMNGVRNHRFFLAYAPTRSILGRLIFPPVKRKSPSDGAFSISAIHISTTCGFPRLRARWRANGSLMIWRPKGLAAAASARPAFSFRS
jgi:hypothetical protein